MKGLAFAGLLALAAVWVLLSAAPEKPPAEYKDSGAFTGGTATAGMVVTGVRFGAYPDYKRMVLDLEQVDGAGARTPAAAHPVYKVEYFKYPYRLVVTLSGTRFDENAKVQRDAALPFSVITSLDGSIKQIQIFLPRPCNFKVIEIDDPAKICIDVQPRGESAVPSVYTVQLTGPKTAADAFALAEQGKFPAGFAPSVIVLGSTVVVEQVFNDAVEAAEMDAALREMGYATVINERRGNELPQG